LANTATVLESYRQRLEDRAAVIEVGETTVLVVADGAGGRPGGARAAEMMIRVVRDSLAESPRCYDPRFWCNILQQADQALVEDTEAGESTAVVVAVRELSIIGASVGDSGAWLIAETALHELTARQQRKPFLGTGMAFPAPFILTGIPGTLLVASDGLFNYTGHDAIGSVVRGSNLEAAARALVDLVRLPSGRLQDDVAVVLCRLES
jgi:serine/threonine protein phosphatase PrpC